MFKVGDKVVCVDNNNTILELDKVYKVREVGGTSGTSIRLFGVSEININTLNDWFYFQNRFRKVDESFATEVLENIKEQIETEELAWK
jgi:hypothetical protein